MILWSNTNVMPICFWICSVTKLFDFEIKSNCLEEYKFLSQIWFIERKTLYFQMLLDILYLVVTTPLALFSCYICVLALRMLLKRGLQEMPWMIVAMLPTCSLTLIAYWGWIITLARCVHYHFPFLRFYISRIILYSSKKTKKEKRNS